MHQTEKPPGALGIFAGWLRETGDARQNRATVEALAPPDGGAVLEIAFGSGHALELLSRKARLGLIAGAEHSESMVESARRRLEPRRGAAALDLRVGDPCALPFADEAFDLVYSVNAFCAWPDKESALAEIAGVLKPGGEVVLSIRDFRTDGRPEPRGAGEAAARAAERLMPSFGLDAAAGGVLHSAERATWLVRGRKRA